MRLFHLLLSVLLCGIAFSQPANPIMRYPDVSDKHIVFSFANDLWLVSKDGGLATRLSSPPGEESWARFSPDGKQIAFTGNYDGASNIYLISVDGGLPEQLTFHSMNERMLDWYPDGKSILFSSSMHSGKQRFNQFYKLPASGGLPEILPIEHAEMGSISPDGTKIAFTDKTRLYRTWKRYRGGTASDIHVFDLIKKTSERITNNSANDELPMWCGNKIYYISDQGEDMRFNLWRYDTGTRQHVQVTFFKDIDVHFPAAGPKDIVFEAGGDLYLMDLKDEKTKKIDVRIVADFDDLKPRQVTTKDYLNNESLSPDGKRIIFEARGELYSVPAEKGATINLSQSSGSAQRYPAWSPDGKSLAFWSDEDGEYELYIQNLETGKKAKMTNFREGFRYQPYWSPDSKNLAFIDQALTVHVLNVETKAISQVVKQRRMNHFALNNYEVGWSPDSRWLALGIQEASGTTSIGIYDSQSGKLEKISAGFYQFGSPVFDTAGKHLFAPVANHFAPIYSGFDNSFVYTNNTQIAAIPLTKKQASPLAPENDEVSVKKEEKEEPAKDDDIKGKKDSKKSEETSEKEKDIKPVLIDFEGISSRVVILPAAPGNYRSLAAADDKILYMKFPNQGETEGKSALKYYDLKEREEKTVIEEINQFQLSADRKKIMVAKGSQISVIDLGADKKMEKMVDLSGMRMQLNPREEWQQLFDESWRIQRDYFYDKNMHGVDWNAVRAHYQKLLERACSRSDVNYVIGEMIGELDASHAYRGGGDNKDKARSDNVGYLGINWKKEGDHFRVDKIIRAAEWDTEVRSPLAEPGLGVEEGEYVLAVNGLELTQYRSPYAAFAGLANKTVELLINSTPSNEGARKVIVKTLDSETRLRNLAWIEKNRKYVDERSGGRIGYIYVPSTGLDGQYELVRMFYGQYRKDALIIDERFNNGGQIPDRFIELLDRKPLAFWKTRDGDDWQWPPVAHFGPKAMLINGWSGSGGDAFPDYFRKAGLGPLIGTRTWGGLIGISGAPNLIDGGSITSPTFRMFHPDGTWFPEGHGVDPDIEVLEDYTSYAKGIDAQLERAIEELMKKLETAPFKAPSAPPMEIRKGQK